MRDLNIFPIKRGKYGITRKGFIYDKENPKGLTKCQPDRPNKILLQCEDKFLRYFTISELVNKVYPPKRTVYVYDEVTMELKKEFDSLEAFMKAFHYPKSHEKTLDKICLGEKPQSKTGKTAGLIITYTKR